MKYWRTVTARIPQSLWCINPENQQRCSFYSVAANDALDTCFAYCCRYRQEWLTSEPLPAKLMRCYFDEDKARLKGTKYDYKTFTPKPVGSQLREYLERNTIQPVERKE